MDTIYIQDLAIETLIGVHAHERTTPQVLRLSLELAADTRAAAVSDDISQTLDYHAIARRITEYAADTECFLLEALAEQLAMLVMAEFDVSWLRLTLGKPAAIPLAREAGVTIERGSRD
ncbi:MAG: dihydroneopterin aldolase [Pseudohongiellaceae bacterium]